MNTEHSPPLRPLHYVIALLPFLLALTGAIGLAVGPAACAINLAIFQKTRLHRLLCKGVALVVSAIAFFGWAWLCVTIP